MHRPVFLLVLLCLLCLPVSAQVGPHDWPEQFGYIKAQGEPLCYMWKTIDDHKQYVVLKTKYTDADTALSTGHEGNEQTQAQTAKDAARKALADFRAAHHIIEVENKTLAYRLARTTDGNQDLFQVRIVIGSKKGAEGWIEEFDRDFSPQVGEAAYIKWYGAEGAFDVFTLDLYEKAEESGDEATMDTYLKLGRVFKIGSGRPCVIESEDDDGYMRCVFDLPNYKQMKLWVFKSGLSALPPWQLNTGINASTSSNHSKKSAHKSDKSGSKRKTKR